MMWVWTGYCAKFKDLLGDWVDSQVSPRNWQLQVSVSIEVV